MVNFPKDQDHELWVLLAQAREAMYKARKRELAKYNLPPRQSSALSFIPPLGEKATLGEISRYIFREHHSTSRLVSRMEKEGLVRKVKDTNEKGRMKIVLTEKGKQAYNQSLKRESIRHILSCLSAEERQHLRSSLTKIRDEALKITMDRELPYPPP